jgi:hypothetical protein
MNTQEMILAHTGQVSDGLIQRAFKLATKLESARYIVESVSTLKSGGLVITSYPDERFKTQVLVNESGDCDVISSLYTEEDNGKLAFLSMYLTDESALLAVDRTVQNYETHFAEQIRNKK